MNKDTLGDRMKKYEDVNRNYLTQRNDVIIRLDGKAFHTFTKNMEKPFDLALRNRLNDTVKQLSKDISGFKLAYLQSDEISIRMNDLENIDSQGWFDYNINKINSVCASLFTMYFNKGYDNVASFDCRCFTIPRIDIPNYFLWRMKDRYRNSIQMRSRSMFSQKELYKKKVNDMIDMCRNQGKPREEISEELKNGMFIYKSEEGFIEEPSIRCNYEDTYDFISKFY